VVDQPGDQPTSGLGLKHSTGEKGTIIPTKGTISLPTKRKGPKKKTLRTVYLPDVSSLIRRKGKGVTKESEWEDRGGGLPNGNCRLMRRSDQ